MAKKRKPDAGITVTDFARPVVEVKNLSIDVRPLNRTRKELSQVRQAIVSAESSVNPNRRLLLELYAEILLDPHLTSVSEKRRLAVTNTDIVCANEKGEQHLLVHKLIDTQWFEQLLSHIIETVGFGYTLIDLLTANLLDPASLEECEIIDRRHVKPELSIVTKTPEMNSGFGYTLPPYNNLYLSVGKKRDLGLLLKALPWILLKTGNIQDWAIFNQIFGMPYRVGKYNSTVPGDREKLKQALEEAGTSTYLILPDGTEIEYIQNTGTAGNAENFQKFQKTCDDQVSKLWLGGTLTTDAGDKGARSLGDVHLEVEEKIAAADRRFVLRILNSKFIPALRYAGYDIQEGYRFDFKEAEEQLSIVEQLDNDLKIHEKVGRIPKKFFAEKYGVTFVDDNDEPEKEEPEPTKPVEKEKKPKEEAVNNADGLSLSHRLVSSFLSFFDQAPKL
ncbi:Mu-like prophage protein gp29 [Pseudarcicella hirudinis]|uniref:Mu-like prophage protein gp29 n=1 Tax=Pseudarcicella hirudinis TaxID=1079859 RepID=A0A1I5MXC0_9BACT|nr:DUF935 family protein [Pseudarcicella hirudinis]SFP14017.1 Mu-like prophage protein gp29 [Pseudarcicella hirudinis]